MGKLLIIKTGVSSKLNLLKCGDCDIQIARSAGIPYKDVTVSDAQGTINPNYSQTQIVRENASMKDRFQVDAP